MMGNRFRLLTEHDVAHLLSGQNLADLMEGALAAFSAGEVVQPVRSVVLVGPERAVLGLMPGHLPADHALGAKLVSVFNSNLQRGLPSHFATILLFDDQTGALLALMDGSHITEVRTAAVSVVAARHLSRRSIRRVAIFGCGVQARSHLRALVAEFRGIDEVRVWSPFTDLAPFVAAMQPEVTARLIEASGGQAASAGADLVVLVTASSSSVIERDWIMPGALVISVGACRRDHREMAGDLVAAARLVVDSRDAALVESGDVVQGIAEGRFGPNHIVAELGEIVGKRATLNAEDHDVVVFKSLGLAVEDLATANLAYHRALAEGVGVDLLL
jgi:alanine dehydrogenase